MVKTPIMTRNQNHDDRKRFKTCESGCVAPWSDVNHDVLFLVMMQLGVVDFVAFSGVCKSWRSFAISNRKSLMACRPPMHMRISTDNLEDYCYLEDFEGKMLKTILPHSTGRTCVGLTCGYLILFGRKTKDFWLVNPITKHQLHFPAFPCLVADGNKFKGILVFSSSKSGWLLVIIKPFYHEVWYSIAGEGVWNHVSSTYHILDIHFLRGKIYTLNIDYHIREVGHLCELRLGLEPNLMLLEIKNFSKTNLLPLPEFVSSGDKLFVKRTFCVGDMCELDFGEMKWVCCEKAKEEYAFYGNNMGHYTVVKRELWAGTNKSRKDTFKTVDMWYFPHDCLNVNLIDES
ncbi:uncharacterized protein LOC111879973 [Lactuca sativa]|uniref:uncharacterized protein LOC111879973 n=1 Tax=Lactuca sativa TaxID=4236 RepID=UPI000CA75389|nr:uncharacterized protein LOC111879973 [Lactuca sativa]